MKCAKNGTSPRSPKKPLDVPEYAHEGLSAWDGCYLDVRGSLDMDNYGPNESYCGTMEAVELIKQDRDVLFGEK